MARLTDADRRMITRARKLAALETLPALRRETGTDDNVIALTRFWGTAGVVLAELAGIAERLGGEEEERR